jgi:hypothetical protein
MRLGVKPPVTEGGAWGDKFTGMHSEQLVLATELASSKRTSHHFNHGLHSRECRP